MSDKQLQTVNNQEYALARRSRPRGLASQVGMVLLEPGAFFRALPLIENSRQWIWVGLLILALVGLSAVRREALLDGDGAPPVDTGAPPVDSGFGGGGGIASVGPGGAIVVQPGGGPSVMPEPPINAPAGGGGDADVADTWTTALLAASGILLGWFILAVLLSEVSLFNGTAPRLGRNFQVAVWTSAPLGLMAALQLLYYAAGGRVGEPGLTGLLGEWEWYAQQPTFTQSLVLSLASRFTLFWLWSLVLLYIGGRMALRGKTWAVAVVVVAWAVVVVVLPVLTGAISAPEAPAPVEEIIIEDMPSGIEMVPVPGADAFNLLPLDGQAGGEMDIDAAPVIEQPESTPESTPG